MVSITLATIGKFKSGAEQDLYQMYEKRLQWKINLKAFDAKKLPSAEQRKSEEAKLLLGACEKADCLIALDEKGKSFSSQEFAHYLQQRMDTGNNHLGFIIGGADGLHESIRQQSHLLLSFGRMTFPHLLVRGLLMEQLYRATTIINHHPYHRE